MLNNFPKHDLEKAYRQYCRLKSNQQYQSDYFHFTCSRKVSTAYFKMRNTRLQEYVDMFKKICTDDIEKIKKDWKILIPIDPNIDLREYHLNFRKIEPTSPLAFLIYAYGISLDDNLIKPRKMTVKQERLKKREVLQKKKMKLLVYTMYISGMFAYRAIGVAMKKDKNTIKDWIQEIEKLTEGDRSALMSEFLTGQQTPNIDVHDLYKAKRRPFGAGEGVYKAENIGRTDEGVYKSEDDPDEID